MPLHFMNVYSGEYIQCRCFTSPCTMQVRPTEHVVLFELDGASVAVQTVWSSLARVDSSMARGYVE